jgi:hypothetical protein
MPPVTLPAVERSASSTDSSWQFTELIRDEELATMPENLALRLDRMRNAPEPETAQDFPCNWPLKKQAFVSPSRNSFRFDWYPRP